jgi:hypothetical protein
LLADTQLKVAATLQPKGELLKLEIWIRSASPEQRRLELWGTSTAASRSVRENVRASIQNQSDWPAVRAFCQGFDFRGPLRVEGLRWGAHFSVPVVLQKTPWHRITVGVINVMSSKNEATSCLRHLNDPGAWEATRKALTTAGQQLLDPDSGIWP